jgi:hypothetical protein
MPFAIPVTPGAFIVDEAPPTDTPKSGLYKTEEVFGKKAEVPKGRLLPPGKSGSVLTNPKKQSVELKSLTPTQESVFKSKVDRISNEWDPHKVGRVEVLHRDNKHYLLNGHHRAAAAIKRGETHLPSNVY